MEQPKYTARSAATSAGFSLPGGAKPSPCVSARPLSPHLHPQLPPPPHPHPHLHPANSTWSPPPTYLSSPRVSCSPSPELSCHWLGMRPYCAPPLPSHCSRCAPLGMLSPRHPPPLSHPPGGRRVHGCESVSYYSTEMCSGSEAGSYSRRLDFCITQL